MNTIIVACVLLSTALVGAEPPRYPARYLLEQQRSDVPVDAPYPSAGYRPQGAAFILPLEFQQQQFNPPAGAYGTPEFRSRYYQPGVQQRFTNARQPDQVEQFDNQPTNNQNQDNQQARFAQQNGQTEFQQTDVNQYSRVSTQKYKPPKTYVPPAKTTESPYTTPAETTTADSATEATTVVSDDQNKNSRQRDRVSGKYTSPTDVESFGGRQDAENATPENAAKEGTYYVLLPGGQLQKVVYMTEEDMQKMALIARLQYQTVEPIRGPIYAYNPMNAPYVQIY